MKSRVGWARHKTQDLIVHGEKMYEISIETNA